MAKTTPDQEIILSDSYVDNITVHCDGSVSIRITEGDKIAALNFAESLALHDAMRMTHAALLKNLDES